MKQYSDLEKHLETLQAKQIDFHLQEENKKLRDEMNMLNRSNSNFKVLGQLEITLDKYFVWEAGKDMWQWMSSKDIINKLYLKSTKGLRATLESYGAVYQKKNNQRGYIMPPENLLFEQCTSTSNDVLF